jgi:hypothetical protein
MIRDLQSPPCPIAPTGPELTPEQDRKLYEDAREKLAEYARYVKSIEVIHADDLRVRLR